MKVSLRCYSLVGADERAKSFLYKMDGTTHMVCMSHKSTNITLQIS